MTENDMQNFEVSAESIINDLVSENRKLALEASTLRAALHDIKKQAEALSKEANGSVIESIGTEVQE